MKDGGDEKNGRGEDGDQDELLFAVKAAEQSLPTGFSHDVGEILGFVEGMAPFLNKETLIQIKCSRCDNFSPSFFPGEGEYGVVESRPYCHAKEQPLHHLNLFTIAKCAEYSREAQTILTEMAASLVEEDLRPALAGKKLYDRNAFASYDVDYRTILEGGRVCIEFGHQVEGGFIESGITVCILSRIDPGLGEDSAKIKAVQTYGRPVMVVLASRQVRRQMDIDEVLIGIAEKRGMDIVFL
ncbi:MAG: hypothetical protein METHAR1v1_1260010 [Methanothrix sp.]|jgi:hypothetical protein|nr:MAG: hypothetical protein METHAR1v1_1260010 [Methanothrix sp.]